MYIKLSEYAKIRSITYKTAWRHFKSGLLVDAFQTDTGTILIPIKSVETYIDLQKKHENVCYCYCRVSTQKQKPDLLKQKERVIEFANQNGYIVNKVFLEVASGVNDNRKELTKIFQDKTWAVLIVEHKDRLTRFGFNYIKELCESQGKKIIVMNDVDDKKTDILQDLISIIYSFSARLYSFRKARNKQERIVKILKEN